MSRILYTLMDMIAVHRGCKLRTYISIVSREGIVTSTNLCKYFLHRRYINYQYPLRSLNNKVFVRYSSSFTQSSRRLTEDVVLYKNDNTQFLKVVNLFGLSFAAFWFFTSFQFATMRITPARQRNAPNLPWFARFDLVGSETTKFAVTALTGLLGCAVLGGAWIYSLRSVGKLILEKGGKSATFITYNPATFSMSKAYTADINKVSCQGHRSMNDTVPVKVKGKMMHFLLSKEGVYQNAPLFDKTVGLKRSF